jgi:hypothetical protein
MPIRDSYKSSSQYWSTEIGFSADIFYLRLLIINKIHLLNLIIPLPYPLTYLKVKDGFADDRPVNNNDWQRDFPTNKFSKKSNHIQITAVIYFVVCPSVPGVYTTGPKRTGGGEREKGKAKSWKKKGKKARHCEVRSNPRCNNIPSVRFLSKGSELQNGQLRRWKEKSKKSTSLRGTKQSLCYTERMKKASSTCLCRDCFAIARNEGVRGLPLSFHLLCAIQSE